ncbi:HAD family hydrolase [Methanobrevibacter sp.]|uniref:HAD family hydrolase n=1 Tax=Methanobrevibacter sp. TaxID=66852 RepID=UPI0025D84E5B|nr:HAD family hydrolase [Methanobrevibacter sp.]MBQ6512583.1 HAD family hydrolase [Methanobrevibacter sp.]
MKKLCIFDFDGTLFDSVDDVVVCFNKALTIYNLPTLTRDEYIGYLGGNIDDIVSLVLKDKNTPENMEIIKKTYLDFYDSSEKPLSVPFPKSHNLLRELQEKNVLIAINSNRFTYSINHFVDKFFSDIDFFQIEGHNLGFPSKPDPYGANKIIKNANVSLDDVIYIGDSITDIETAKNIGIDCVIVKWGYGVKTDWENDYILDAIDDFSQILDYF